ncbi:MAG: ComEC/Rec2 family competence protein, partial [Anaerolineales bacterium]|nr:ComEC/Rec2 family competence protein [Anaerolineales bacterium]
MPLLWLSLAFLAGILLAANTSLPTWVWMLLAALSLSLGIIRSLFARLPYRFAQSVSQFIHRLPPLPVPLFLVFLALFLGAVRYQVAQPDLVDPGFIASYNDQEAEFIIEGILVEPPDQRDAYTNLRLSAEEIRPIDNLLFTPVGGLLLARVPANGDWRYGDRLRLEGWLETPPENEEFSYRDYLARQGIHSYMGSVKANLVQRGQGNIILGVIYNLKARALATVYRIYPDPEASLLAGILLGVETGIPEDVQRAFKDTGTSHIIAISGFNITILAALFAILFGRLLGRWRGAMAALVAIAIYTILVGADAAVVRAAIMGGLTLFAAQIGRRQDGLNTLAFVAALMALFNPYVLWDVGFQLSFAATLGLLLYAEPLTQAFVRLTSRRTSQSTAERLAGPFGEYFLFTLAAQVTILAVIVYHFKRLSLTSLVANPVILPAQPAVMILGGLAVILGMVWLPLGQLAAYLAWPFVVFTIRAVEFLSRIPGGVITLGDVAIFWVVLFYAVLFLLTFGGSRLRAMLPAIKPSLAFVILGVLTMLVWRAAASAPDGRLHMSVLDVGSGEAVLIQSPTGRYLLVNGGPSPSRLSDALGRRLPLNHRRLDYLVVASPSEQGIAALPRAIERYPPDNVLWAGPTHGTRSARYLQEALNAAEIRPVRAETGQTLHLGDGAQMHVLAVGKRGAVLLL